nr:reverse transcriptase domain-containing protein [Tanacetum cinerariifolium]
PRVPLYLGRSFLRTGRALIDVYGEEITLWVNDESVTFNLNQTMRYSSTYDDNSVNRIDVIDITCEEYVQDVLDFKYNSKSGNPTLEYVQDMLDFKYNSKSGNPTLVSNPSLSKEIKSKFCKEPIVKSSSLTLTPFGESDLFLEEIKDFLKDESIPKGIEDSYHGYLKMEMKITMTLSGSGKEKLFKLKKVESFKARPDLNGKAINESQCKADVEDIAAVGCCSNILWIKSQLTDYDIIYEKDHLVRNEVVRVKIHKCMSWLDAYDEPIGDIDMMEDKIDNPSPQSTSQVLPSFKVYTPPVTYPKEVEETLGTPMEEETIKETQLKDLDLNTCKHDISFGSREVPIYDEP